MKAFVGIPLWGPEPGPQAEFEGCVGLNRPLDGK